MSAVVYPAGARSETSPLDLHPTAVRAQLITALTVARLGQPRIGPATAFSYWRLANK
jgi:hypothetical protein